MTHHSIIFHTLLLSLLHLLVDGVCACGVMLMSCQIASYIEACGLIVLYDVLAFGTQPLTGLWIDKSSGGPRKLKLAMVLLLGGVLMSMLHVSPNFLAAIIGAILLGMGNSLFHVYGGKYVAVISRNDIRVMGVFVSTGAFGLAIGIGFFSPSLMSVFLLALLAISVLHLHNDDIAQTKRPLLICTGKEVKQTSAMSDILFLYLSCLMLVVAGRVFIGESVPLLRTSIHPMGAPVTMVVVSFIVMTGKAAGGFLSKKWGVRNVFYISMLLSATTFLMCPWHDAFVLTTLLLINISMPCTLYWATNALPGREGLGFGLLTIALLPGFLLGNLSKDNATCQYLLAPLMVTFLLESFLLLCMHEHRWKVLASSVVLNILTNVPLNAFIMGYNIISPRYLFGLECLVIAVEFIGYWFVLNDRRIAFRYSFLCNSFSALVGCVYQY